MTAKRHTLKKNQAQKRTLTQMQVIKQRDKEGRQKRRMKSPGERYKENIAVREIKIKVRKP